MSDPNFPDRPDHDDFWALAEIVIDIDTEMDKTPEPGKADKFTEMLGRCADVESVVYLAQQRASRMDGGPLVAAAWIDGFMAGVQFGVDKTNDYEDNK